MRPPVTRMPHMPIYITNKSFGMLMNPEVEIPNCMYCHVNTSKMIEESDSSHYSEPSVYERIRCVLFLSVLLLIMPASAELIPHDGFPVLTNNTAAPKLITADLDGDGILEIIAALDNREIQVFGNTGVEKWRKAGGIVHSDNARVPVARNLTGDGNLEVISYGNPDMINPTNYIWDFEGNNLVEMLLGDSIIVSSPAITKEGIILNGAATGTSHSGPIINGTGLHAFYKNGNRLWYLELGVYSNTYASIPLVDLDNDGLDEAVVLTQDNNDIGKVWAIKVNSTQGTELWNVTLGGDARRVAAGELNNDGRNEIVVFSTGGVYIFDNNGSQLFRFDINTNTSAAPVIGDLDRDGVNEVIFASHFDKNIYIISNGILSNFTISTLTGTRGRVAGDVALGDLNGDGKLEIAAGDIANNIYVWYYNGTIIEHIYISEDSTTFASAVIADLERDGKKELILGHDSGRIYVFTYNNTDDSTPPVTIDNVVGSWHNSSVTVLLTASDDKSGVFKTYYTIDGSIPTTDSPTGSTIIINSDGIYNLSYFSIDKAENQENIKTATEMVRVDLSPPLTYNDSDGLWHNTNVYLNLNSTDSLSGLAMLYYNVDDTDYSSSGNVTYEFTEEGIHTVEYYGVDSVGNIESIKNTTVKIDRTPPVTTDNSDGSVHNSNVTVLLSAIDTVSEVNTTYYKVTKVSTSVFEYLVSLVTEFLGLEENFTEGNTVLITEDGVYNITYYSVDLLGNQEDVKFSQEVMIDKSYSTTAGDLYINGTVVNATHQGIPYAKVTTNTSMNTTADSTGFYSLQVDTGSYMLTATSDPEYYANSSVIVEMLDTFVQDIELVEKPKGTITGSVKNT